METGEQSLEPSLSFCHSEYVKKMAEAWKIFGICSLLVFLAEFYWLVTRG